MDSLSLDKIPLLLIFFVPGFISLKVFELMVPGEKRNWQGALFEAIGFSCINFALTFWVFFPINSADFYRRHPFWFYLIHFGILFILPIIWAISLNALLKLDFFAGKIVELVPTAWDYFFSQRKACWILARLKSGDLIGGLYGNGSFSANFPYHQDIYISEVWRISETGQFLERVPQTKGAWIPKKSIELLEFFDLQELELPTAAAETAAARSDEPRRAAGSNAPGYQPVALEPALPAPPSGGSGVNKKTSPDVY
ncbi:hypothetical protein EDC14_101561 [Hydrogenispora ethanolica]|uniref:Uncharacterized protein n=1 Tax=Hydrogenispora ethanolica TaxID=1082276 RepID=A0A4R1RK16_HYDET|nr:DUF6338 family protein [Hydrogenispora ethanolica]TCL66518.1 hypothetical protein EDC14_101561 [Hydrogenispora ethanolica]